MLVSTKHSPWRRLICYLLFTYNYEVSQHTQTYSAHTLVYVVCTLFFVEYVQTEIVEGLLLPQFKGAMSTIEYIGSSYERNALVGTSDYDLQLFFTIKDGSLYKCPSKRKSVVAEWKKIRGGPIAFRKKSYLSAYKVNM